MFRHWMFIGLLGVSALLLSSSTAEARRGRCRRQARSVSSCYRAPTYSRSSYYRPGISVGIGYYGGYGHGYYGGHGGGHFGGHGGGHGGH